MSETGVHQVQDDDVTAEIDSQGAVDNTHSDGKQVQNEETEEILNSQDVVDDATLVVQPTEPEGDGEASHDESAETPYEEIAQAPHGEEAEFAHKETTEFAYEETTEAPPEETAEAPPGETAEAPLVETAEAINEEGADAPPVEIAEALPEQTAETLNEEGAAAPLEETAEAFHGEISVLSHEDKAEATHEETEAPLEETATAPHEETLETPHEETAEAHDVNPDEVVPQTDDVVVGEEPDATIQENEVSRETITEVQDTAADEKQMPDSDSQDKIAAAASVSLIQLETSEPSGVDVSTERNDQVPDVDPHGASPRSEYPADATATVKFMLMPIDQVVTLAFTLGQTMRHFKDHFSVELNVPASSLIIIYDDKAQTNSTTLGSLGVQPNGTIQLELQSADPDNFPLGAYRPRDDYHMPDVISVRVQLDNGEYKDVVVEIARPTKKKPYLGGYRHKKTGIEYHHAAAQTVAKPLPIPLGERNCRETQTVQQQQQLQQTTNDMSTQMTGIGVYISNVTDKLVIPGSYVTAEERAQMITRKVVTLQKYFRRWYSTRYVNKVREARDRRLEWERQEEEKKRREKEERIKREFERRMNPKTKEDFDLLYHALEKWRLEELDLINKTLSGAERKAALCQLLEQETQLIASIGRNKLDADDLNRDQRIQRFLGKAAAPKRWKGRDGKWTQMDTPYTIRARELTDIYNSVNMKYVTQDERLDVLLTLKHTVKEHDCKLTQDLIELIDREADLLIRGVKEANLEGLRKRISTLFLQYIKTPTFNPEITKYLKVPQDPAILRKDIYFCSSCNRYLPSTEFHLTSNERSVGKCKRCRKVDNDARDRQDYSYYKNMLKNLRKAEEEFKDSSKIAFLLQEGDLRYLVENVWNSQSMLSAWDDLYDLELVRWDVRDEWSPWNTILLTKEEAAAHAKLESLEKGYGKMFVHKTEHKHTLARNYFSRLPGMAELMREKDIKQETRMPSVSGKKVSVQALA